MVPHVVGIGDGCVCDVWSNRRRRGTLRQMMRSQVPTVALLVLGACARSQSGESSAPPTDATASPAAVAEVKPQAPAQEPPLPLDPDVRTGTLDNGLTFYIRKHDKPAGRALLWLAVDAGSVLEDEDQLGLAHFVEHMAFNGTERFEKNTLIDFIERAGMDFGADVNAYTSFDETVYMLKVPTDDPKVVATGMDILEDWASAVTFDPAEVEKERGVVVEEWRLGRGADQRIFDEQWPVFLKGSKYAHRKPIGERSILETAPVETLQRYYREWYRPELMAVIVVGDIDPAAAEQDIRQRFGDLENPTNGRARELTPVPILDDTRAARVTDPEAPYAEVTLAFKVPLTPVRTAKDYRQELVQQLFHDMLTARLSEIAEDPNAPYAFAYAFQASMGRAVDVFEVAAFAKPGQVDKSTAVLTRELERVKQHGFLASELARQKAEVLRAHERDLAEQAKTDASNFASELVEHFLDDEAVPGRRKRLELAQAFLPTIELEDVLALIEPWAKSRDRVVFASGAERDPIPPNAELLAIVEKTRKEAVGPYSEAAVAKDLMTQRPEPGSIVTRETIDAIGTTVWTLGNGAKVVVKPTEFKADEVRLRAFSVGGHSLASDRAYRSASTADGIVSDSGLGPYDAATLRKMTAGKIAWVTPWINELEEGLNGSASPKDLELLMQMVYLNFTLPRKDPEGFDAWRGRIEAFIKNRDLDPQAAFFDAFNVFAYDNHLRRRPITMEAVAEVDLETAYAFYQDRFADAGDFTFVFVGNVDLASFEGLVTRYLASLPTQGRKETWKDVKVKLPSGVKQFKFERGQDPKAFVYMTYHGKSRWSPEAVDDLDMLAEVIDIRLREVLREELGGVYGAFSFGQFERWPKASYEYSIGFGCGPENVARLKQATFDIVASIKASGIGEDYVAKVKEQRRRQLETDLEENSFWLNRLVSRYRHGLDPAQLVDDATKAVERVRGELIQETAKKYLRNTRLEALLLPEAKPAPSPSPAATQAP